MANIADFETAKDLVNKTYQPLGYLKCMVSNDELWKWAKERTIENIELIKDQLPMYTGNLNPRWKYWDDLQKSVIKLP